MEAIEQALAGLPQHQVEVDVVASGVGSVTESEIEYAKTTGSQILLFNVPLDKRMEGVAISSAVQVHAHNVIYKLLDHVKDMMADRLPKEEVLSITGEATVQQMFSITSKKTTEKVAGCKILSGKIMRNSSVRVIRNEEEVWRGSLRTLKHIKKDILEAPKGTECGLSLDGFADLVEGDIVQAIQITLKRGSIV